MTWGSTGAGLNGGEPGGDPVGEPYTEPAGETSMRGSLTPYTHMVSRSEKLVSSSSSMGLGGANPYLMVVATDPARTNPGLMDGVEVIGTSELAR